MPGAQQVACAYSLLGIAAYLSWHKGLGLEKDFLWAGLRMGVQLLLLGIVLKWILAHPSSSVIVTAAIVMTINAALHSTTRVRRRYPGLILQNLITTLLAVWPLVMLGVGWLSPDNLLDPNTSLPLLGMVLGNSLNGITLGLDAYTDALHDKHDHILSVLALGATPPEATVDLHRKALRAALTPVLNSMLACGIISIPGMMTGQLLAGGDPITAALYQLIIMILVSCGGFLGALIGLKLCERRHFDERGIPCWK